MAEKERRRRAGAIADEIEIGPFERAVAQETVAKRLHHGPVLARIRIGDRGDRGRADGATRIGQKRAMEGALGGTSLGRRHQLRPRQIGLQELVRDEEPAVATAIREGMAAREPEIPHSRGPPVAGSSQDGIASANRRSRRTAGLPNRSIRRSPFASIVWITPRSRVSFAT